MIKLSRPNINDADVAAVTDVLYSESLVQGVQVKSFEDELKAFLSVEHVVAVTSGTAALHLCLMELDVGPNDVVYIPDYTFVATANVARVVKANIVLIDVDLDSYCLSPEAFSKQVAQTRHKYEKAYVIPVMEFGCPINSVDISALCQNEDIEIIEDAACALGAQSNGSFIGSNSRYSCFSFHPRKTVTTGEGGFIATNDENIATRLRSLRNHGLKPDNKGSHCVEIAGLNYRLTDIAAALGRSQLKRLSDSLQIRKKLAAFYYEYLGSNKNIRLPADIPGHSWQSFVVQLPSDRLNLEIIKKMKEKGIETSVGAYSLSLQPAYASLDNDELVNSKHLARHGIAIPLCHTLREEDIKTISTILINVIKA